MGENKWVKVFVKIVSCSLFFALCLVFCSMVMQSMPVEFLHKLSPALQSTQDQGNFALLVLGFSTVVVGLYECCRSLPGILETAIPRKHKPEQFACEIKGG